MRRRLICGDRNWRDYDFIKRRLEEDPPDVVIHGGARGTDSLGGKAARELHIPEVIFEAEWDKYGRAAGPIRNQKQLDEGKPTEAWAFHDDIENSRGTADMVRRLRKAGVPVEILSHD